MDLLPDDVVANILGRLPPCSVAGCRGVRREWRATIDGRRLLRADLLPLRLDGFFCRATLLDSQTYFFAPPSAAQGIDPRLDFLGEEGRDYANIVDLCNGLLLLWDRVVNPATRQWIPLTPFPRPCAGMEGFFYRLILAYDPLGLMPPPPHCSVVRFPIVPIYNDIDFTDDSEWPPSTFTIHIFSSAQRVWQERSFVRQGAPTGTIADMRHENDGCHRRAVFFRGALYVHCQNNSVIRIALSDNKYRMITSPATAENQVFHHGHVCLGKSDKGVYSAFLSKEDEWPWCRVWLLDESCHWVLKSNISLRWLAQNFPFDNTDKYSRPWINNSTKHVHQARVVQDESEWDFDSGVTLPDEISDSTDVLITYGTVFLGFHPYKEIAFFSYIQLKSGILSFEYIKGPRVGRLN
ncbi:hypothetical protein HU200_040360 [Digitaria exilis]|uniref:F-box domain-containing protein n=1 Tax=Digitaria exilis TaxID=1010633 RepID=A0A835EJX9_9POAL|nr:hypothetical protein HU200_040360 [Digitaria exilis]